MSTALQKKLQRETTGRVKLTLERCGRCDLRLLAPIHEPVCQCIGNVLRPPTEDLLIRTWRTDRAPLWQRAMKVLRPRKGHGAV